MGKRFKQTLPSKFDEKMSKMAIAVCVHLKTFYGVACPGTALELFLFLIM